MAKTYNYLFKLLLIGDAGVGKAGVLSRFSDDSHNDTLVTTVGVDFKVKTIDLDGKKVKLQMWDTAGQERFQTITTSYYRGAMGVMLVYDITNETSFENIKKWIKNVEEHASMDVVMILVGNNCEMDDRRQVCEDRGEQLATEHGMKFMEISHRCNINVKDAFFTLARDIKEKIDRKRESEELQPTGGGSHQLNEKYQPEESTGKCAIL
ncbi:hypothetical protein ACJMK2_024493 [Sinanodonta woodiana]|uniref:Ras-related protein Rab-13 n=1 Tax=Sinanodonta woodiana TaxID=1069815 RepID=A0ABD3XDI9_SINWO